MYRDTIMDGAVTQSYAFDSSLADTTDLSRRSSKKRRLGEQSTDSGIDQLESWPSQQQQYASHIHGAPVSIQKYDTSARDISYTSSADTISGSTALTIPQTAQSWAHPNTYPVHNVNSYPEIAPYSQPYYHDQNDSVAYAASWPPLGHVQPSYELSGAIYPQAAELEPLQYAYPGTATFPNIPAQESSSALPVRPGIASMDGGGNTFNTPISTDSAHTQMLRHSLPSLDNWAMQIIHTIITISNHALLQSMLQNDVTDAGRSFRHLKFNFEQTRHIFTRESTKLDAPFIASIAMPEFGMVHQDTLRKANIATFLLAVLDAPTISMPQLHEHFLQTFVPYQQKLLKWQGMLLLELKTQGYIAALRDGHPSDPLDIYFPFFAEEPLLLRHPETPSLFPPEREFVDKCQARRQYLFDKRLTTTYADLAQKYPWNDFVQQFVTAVCGNINGLLCLSTRGQRPQSTDSRRRVTSGSASSPQVLAASTRMPTASDASDGPYRTGSSHGPSSSIDARKPTSTGATVRQPWTKPEEEALLEGLERVNGPHWSQILALYGRGGSINEVLKDRNQVQLKDKARNLKLWHLKMGKEVPNNLKGVTGELRKRGGARARAALEAEEKTNARLERGISDGSEGTGIDPRLNTAGTLAGQTSRI